MHWQYHSNKQYSTDLNIGRFSGGIIYIGTILSTIGPSGVHALPLGVSAERSVHYIWYYFSFFFLFLSVPHTFLPEGVVLGLKNKIWGKKKDRDPP
jgi:hypothetical protein